MTALVNHWKEDQHMVHARKMFFSFPESYVVTEQLYKRYGI